MTYDYDAVVVGSGPNGLAAAVVIARAGRRVLVLEGAPVWGGGTRTEEVTLPGFRHDICSAVHPMGIASPFFAKLPLAEHGLEWMQPEFPLAHVLDRGAAIVRRSVDETADGFGVDASSWRRVYGRLARLWPDLAPGVLGPVLKVPRHPIALASLGIPGLLPATVLARWIFGDDEARAVFAGCAAHAILPLDRPLTSSFGLLFGVTAQTVGWPVARGGSQAISDALVTYLRALGGEVECNRPVNGWDDLPAARAVLFDTSPTTLLRVAGDRLPTRYAGRLRRFRHGPGSFKLDLAVEGPIPWRDERAGRAGTVHIGGTLEEVSAAERSVWRGEHPERPYVLLSQPSVVDETRAPPGKQAVWVYCHVPAESKVDMTERIEAQVERFAPGFRERVLARHAMGPAALEAHNPNNVGGDISGGAHTGLQLIARPFPSMDPYFTGTKGIYLCSSSTPPGAGVHGMCGYWAARSALKRDLR